MSAATKGIYNIVRKTITCISPHPGYDNLFISYFNTCVITTGQRQIERDKNGISDKKTIYIIIYHIVFRKKEVRAHLQEYLCRASGLTEKREHLIEVCVLCVQCMEVFR